MQLGSNVSDRHSSDGQHDPTFTDSGESMWRPSSWDISASVLYAPVAIMTAPICRGMRQPVRRCVSI
jgi:hypothetical protein